MIPAPIIRFLEGATVGFAVTRDKSLVPHLHRLVAWRVGATATATATAEAGADSVDFVFAADVQPTLLPTLEDNGQIACTLLGSLTGPRASEPSNPVVDFNECYQFKGEFIGSRAPNEGDVASIRQTAARFKSLFQPIFGFSDQACDVRFGEPVVAVTVRIQEIYDQTPGPGAGKRISPEAG